MKRIKSIFRHLKAPVPTLCYGAALLLWLAACLLRLAADTADTATNRAPLRGLALQTELQLVNATLLESDTISCDSPDPQLIWENTDGIRVQTLRLTAEYEEQPGEICLYYRTPSDEGFSAKKRVFAKANADGSYSFYLPRRKFTALRLDICSETGVVTDISVTLNTPRSAARCFAVTGWGVFYLLLLPGLAASAVNILGQIRAPEQKE